ncbi:hypothetical protein PILCRDRAFT_819693 [Piloderma croceum F 1598]|uniref:Uncharacterized protein n=1 Tax=Piloderma croceum (strain F 1598) TaxID=765440 RepID=A0A0C3FGC2_PILCF|nr:hypothetical protein PILCRDRAFT_819693 [Piloderma croceum F 1598]
MKRLTPESAKKLKDLGNRAVRLRFNRIRSQDEVVYQGVEAEYAWGEEISVLFFEDYFKPYAEIMSSSWRDTDCNEHRYKIHIRRDEPDIVRVRWTMADNEYKVVQYVKFPFETFETQGKADNGAARPSHSGESYFQPSTAMNAAHKMDINGPTYN